MNFSAEYQLTFEEFTEVSLCVNKQYQKRVVRAVPRGVVATIFIIGSSVFLFFLTHNGKQSIRSTDIMLGSCPIILGFAVLVIAMIARRGMIGINLRKAWDTSPTMHRPNTIHITDIGVALSEVTATHQYSWEHFIRFFETPSMFLLFINEYFVLEIPKRIFGDEKIQEQARELFRREVTEMTHGFPVASPPTPNSENDQNESH